MNYANVAYDLLPYNMEAATLPIKGNCKWRHCHLLYYRTYCSCYRCYCMGPAVFLWQFTVSASSQNTGSETRSDFAPLSSEQFHRKLPPERDVDRGDPV